MIRRCLTVLSISTVLCLPLSVTICAQELDVDGRVLQRLEISGATKDTQPSVEACWRTWKSQEGLKEGKNEHNGHLILLSYNQESVNQEEGQTNWLAARKLAFETAELNARAQLAATMATEIKSDRNVAARMFGGDDAAPALESVVKQLSLAEKTQVLAGKVLDNEISKYTPNWNDTASIQQKKDAIVKLQAQLQEDIAAHSELYTAGAFTVVQCEGQSTSDGGKYSVLVGLIWSPKLAKIAESIWNPAIKLPPEPVESSLDKQFAAFSDKNPDWLAYSLGARVFTDEKGEYVVVGFGVAPQSSMMSVDKRRASLDALAAIQRFVGEKVEANSEEKERFERREFASGENSSFDTSVYINNVNARSQDLKLSGVTEVASWRGVHPWSSAKMQVVAMAWTPQWSTDSIQAAAMMRAIEKHLNGQGATPDMSRADAKKTFKSRGVAVPAHSGAPSSTHNF